jgi:hypothetical protein
MAAGSWTGVATGASGYLDVTADIKEDFNSTWTTNNLVTTNADDLLIGYSVGPGASAHVATSPYTELHEWLGEGVNRIATVYRIVSATSTYTPGGTWTSPSFESNIGLSYKASTGAPEVTPTWTTLTKRGLAAVS